MNKNLYETNSPLTARPLQHQPTLHQARLELLLPQLDDLWSSPNSPSSSSSSLRSTPHKTPAEMRRFLRETIDSVLEMCAHDFDDDDDEQQ